MKSSNTAPKSFYLKGSLSAPQQQFVNKTKFGSHHIRIRSKLKAQNGEDQDFIESLVSRLFGRKALEDKEPMGMKRIDVPEMYPATTNEFAAPIASDTQEMALIRPLLAKTQLETAPLRLAYDSSVDGWSADAFHSKVNTFGAGLVVLKTKGGAICGGYNPRGWIGLGEDRDSIAAFLFTWPDGNISKETPIKLPKVGGASLAVIDKPESGIQFGPDGLKLLVPGKERKAKSRLGSYYSKLPKTGGRSLFSEGEESSNKEGADVVWLKCYVAQGSGESWELDGIIWKTSTETTT